MVLSSAITRRAFARAGLALSAPAGLLQALQRSNGKIPIAVQLYSVRKFCEQDLPGTLAGVAKAGYQGVEFAGYYNRTAKELRKLLDDNGLKCCGTHTGLSTVTGGELDKTIEFNRILGNRNLVVPSLPEKNRASKQAWLETANLFNDIAAKVKPAGMRVGYHNHEIEFKMLDGEMPWDTFFGNTSKEVMMQVDTGNCMHGGGDPTPYISRYPGRAITVHIKAYSTTKKNPLIGEDDMDWPKFFKLCETVGGTEWYIVEEESGAYPGLEAVSRSLANLRKMGK
jgi:sugar phosphate isomerase/epimerase